MREQLIRYLLGELDEFEHRELRAKLQVSPELQRELAQLRECFAANQDDDAGPLPPGGLAERTADRVSNSDEFQLEVATRRSGMAPSSEPPAGILGWSLADLTVAGGVMLAVSMLVFPALRDSRDGTRRTVCQNNQQQLWLIATRYARDHHGFYPQIRPNENAGIMLERLVETGYVEPSDLAVWLVCPASPIAREIKSGELAYRIPSREEFRLMGPEDLLAATAQLSHCYGIRMPQKIGDDYVDQRVDTPRQSRLDPLFGDMSGDPSNSMTAHHRGSVIQFVDRNGSVVSLLASAAPATVLNDADPYRNDIGMMAAGIGQSDVVIAASNALPGLESTGREK
jgi:hypothetical protein